MNGYTYFGTEGIYSPDNLVAGEFPVVTAKATVAAGQGVLKRGTVLGQLTANDELVLIDKTRVDGGQQVHGVLVHDVDTSLGAVESLVYLTGVFNEGYIAELNGFGADTADDHRKAARALNLYFKTNLEH